MAGQLAGALHPELDAAACAFPVRLDDVEGGRATDLAAYFGLTKPTVSRQLALLERVGLVEKRPDPEDGRAQMIALTEAGRARMQEVRRTRHQRFVDLMTKWPDAEIASLAALLSRLDAALGAQG